MNCVIYGVKCLYTPPYSPSSSTRKKAESSASASKTPSNKKLSQIGDRSSQSPSLLDHDSPGSSYADDVGFSSQTGGQPILPKFSDARRLAAGWFSGYSSVAWTLSNADCFVEFINTTQSTAEIQNLSERLDHYAQYLTTYSESTLISFGVLSEDTGLPPQHIANAILQGRCNQILRGSDGLSSSCIRHSVRYSD